MVGILIGQDQVSGLTSSIAAKAADGDAFKADRQVIVTPTITSGVLTLDLSQGAVFEVSWTVSITSVVVVNCPSGMANWALVLIGAGGSSVAWNTSIFKFVGGTAPTLNSTTGAHNFLSMASRNSGGRIDVFSSGATF